MLLSSALNYTGVSLCATSYYLPRAPLAKLLLWYCQVCAPVAVAKLEECCMAFANMQWPFLSDERIVAHRPLVLITADNGMAG